jgi:[protein-PII] uridylyltransferase
MTQVPTWEKILERKSALWDSLSMFPSGMAWCSEYSDLADGIWQQLWLRLVEELGNEPDFAIVATGGYGRRELSPSSDLDVVLVPFPGKESEVEGALGIIGRLANDTFRNTLSIPLNCALRWIHELPGLDDKSLAALLEARYIIGSHDAFRLLTDALWRDFPTAEFLVSKVAERRNDLLKSHATPLVTEPDLKRGAGGLRCVQTANWIGSALGERLKHPPPSYDHLLLVRNCLHLVAGKPLDTLSFSRRSEVAQLLKQDPRELGSHLVESMILNYGIFVDTLEKIKETRFSVSPLVSAVRGQVRLEVGCSAGEAAQAIALALKLGLAVPKTKVSVQPEADSSCLTALFSGVETIRALDEAGVLEPLLPELTACRTLMPRDGSHRYTVFEHTLQTVALLDQSQNEPFLREVRAGISDLGPLYLAALLHDVGKIDDRRSHSIVGAEIAERVCNRLGLDSSRTALVVWLVKEHLSLAHVLRTRDVMNQETAVDFRQFVGTQECLDCLTLLTWADVNAVNDNIWTPVQETFLRELYRRTKDVLASGQESRPNDEVIRRQLLRTLRKEDAAPAEIEGFVKCLPVHYLMSTQQEVMKMHFQMARKAQEGMALVDLADYPAIGVTTFTIVSPDQPGNLTKILGVLYSHDLSLIGLRAASTRAPHAVLVDEVTVSSSGRSLPAKLATVVAQDLVDVLEGRKTEIELLRQKRLDPERRQETVKISYTEGSPGIIDIRAPKGRGMAYRISRVIAAQGWNILAARLGAWAGQGTASFYVLSPTGEGPEPEAVWRAFKANKV